MTAKNQTEVTRSASTGRGSTLIVLAAITSATSGPLAKPAIDAGLSPHQVTSVRIGLAAALFLTVVVVWRPALLRVRRPDRRLLAGYGLVGMAGVQLCYFAAVARIPIGIAMLLMYTSPVLVALWVRFVRGTVLPARMWFGTVLALAGLAMVAQVWDGLRLDGLGLLAGVGAALCAAVYFLVAERAAHSPAPVGLVAWGMVVGAAATFVLAPPWTLPFERFGADTDLGPVWLLLVGCAVVATALAYLFAIAALRHLPANVASVLGLTEPVVAAVLAWLLLGQDLTAAQVAGAAVLLAGATMVQLVVRRG